MGDPADFTTIRHFVYSLVLSGRCGDFERGGVNFEGEEKIPAPLREALNGGLCGILMSYYLTSHPIGYDPARPGFETDIMSCRNIRHCTLTLVYGMLWPSWPNSCSDWRPTTHETACLLGKILPCGRTISVLFVLAATETLIVDSLSDGENEDMLFEVDHSNYFYRHFVCINLRGRNKLLYRRGDRL